ncbi:hypothetical protein BGZ99_007303 [Dissophora globulifera]|uniref:Uncharacterized protein n=1 Tax=Dissophora globulifera TaxID=979702 RepID=A0A9P6RRW0_9FUNG|nr:hypothetical protein BGZ99_007303 [Dissophora globulifera]
MKNQPETSRFNHSSGSLFVLSTRSTGIIAAVSVGLAAVARPYGSRMSNGGLLVSVGALQCCWLGANLAISFLEAPVKFLAPTPARRSLIDVGRHVFSALNKVEVVLAVFDLLGWYLLTQRSFDTRIPLPFATVIADMTRGSPPGLWKQLGMGWRQWIRFTPGVVVLALQSFGFLPAMRNLGTRFIEGLPTEHNNKVHGIYVMLEAIKIVALSVSTASIAKTLMALCSN